MGFGVGESVLSFDRIIDRHGKYHKVSEWNFYSDTHCVENHIEISFRKDTVNTGGAYISLTGKVTHYFIRETTLP